MELAIVGGTRAAPGASRCWPQSFSPPCVHALRQVPSQLLPRMGIKSSLPLNLRLGVGMALAGRNLGSKKPCRFPSTPSGSATALGRAAPSSCCPQLGSHLKQMKTQPAFPAGSQLEARLLSQDQWIPAKPRSQPQLQEL